MIKACIFDLDGVIVDTAKYHYMAWKKLADQLNIPFNEKDNERLKGVSRMKSLEIILDLGNLNLSLEEKEELAQKKNNWYVEYISKMDKSELLPGVEKFIKILKSKGIKIAIASASKNTKLILERLNFEDVFDAVIDGTMISNAKPNPEIFLTASNYLSLKPEECVVFEDAVAGIQAAKRAGMKVIGVGEEEVLKGADKVIKNFENINLTLIESI
ncbi:beta-phosphoglucomutase [Petrotoga mobilis SJ95]|uniref:Beta-phosphoglucomutase n=1 Tax=Petrotoga mobilis (strain DSM 10674 / SJ95) TaxID=403833 RepID=A9BFA4_PETMO|nr:MULTISPECIES: beta-phosphoglucomutase [Petrotoga]MBL5981218.1 beta-phosphoglucomutase [Petrotoga sp. 8T1HF07.NaAc.6.1]MDI3473574.1 beta-phosphoglucomutase [Thermotogaceae bacterium]ABX30889.1 beta-phosphoglucomutase [Petrotoga mobilis SJ95]RLL83327.1 beta-phosphoglucomutase [Petrotoga sp. Shatin.DS.tank11.9.2.9.3]RLL90463.1 beta-phosphoglucomutase [Petrotoga sp. HKA.pet.4.5]